MRDISAEIQEKITNYSPAGGLDSTARVLLALAKINHGPVKGHSERLAMLVEFVALLLGQDAKAAFFAALMHDIGKIILPPDLFDGHDISDEEYVRIKTHAQAAFEALKDVHCFVALCAGFHHAMYKAGYGLDMSCFPKDWSPATIKKVLDISMIISVCDHVDASHRSTAIKDGSSGNGLSLRENLIRKYPGEEAVIEAALAAEAQLNLYD